MGWMLIAAMVLQGAPAEMLVASMPAGFKTGYEAAQGGQTIEERVPTAETVENWSRMITLQRFSGIAAVGAHGLLERLGGLMAQSCPGAKVGAITNGTEGGHPVAALRVDCPLNGATGKPETMFARAFQGASNVYLAQYAYRSKPTAEQAGTATAYLATVRLREAAKYASRSRG